MLLVCRFILVPKMRVLTNKHTIVTVVLVVSLEKSWKVFAHVETFMAKTNIPHHQALRARVGGRLKTKRCSLTLIIECNGRTHSPSLTAIHARVKLVLSRLPGARATQTRSNESHSSLTTWHTNNNEISWHIMTYNYNETHGEMAMISSSWCLGTLTALCAPIPLCNWATFVTSGPPLPPFTLPPVRVSKILCCDSVMLLQAS